MAQFDKKSLQLEAEYRMRIALSSLTSLVHRDLPIVIPILRPGDQGGRVGRGNFTPSLSQNRA
jgi:hypothetical protein